LEFEPAAKRPVSSSCSGGSSNWWSIGPKLSPEKLLNVGIQTQRKISKYFISCKKRAQ
jgi:hypothetical protein